MANKKKEILKKKAAAKTGAKPAGQKKAAPKKKAPVKARAERPSARQAVKKAPVKPVLKVERPRPIKPSVPEQPRPPAQIVAPRPKVEPPKKIDVPAPKVETPRIVPAPAPVAAKPPIPQEQPKEAPIPAAPIIAEEKGPKVLDVPTPVMLKDLAGRMGIRPNVIISKLIENGIFANINQNLGEDIVKGVLTAFGFEYRKQEAKESVNALQEEAGREEKMGAAGFIPRAPVVTFMGHVDHGKTSLLDFIRKTRVADKEKGGITQHIGAYTVKFKKGSVTFLDTPGHEAFTAMRARGASATDVVVLVVAADDGVMPQTKEAIDHARAAGVPIVIAINKCDLPTANIDKVKGQLAQIGLAPEGWGGKAITVPVSAKTGEGVDNLLEMLLLEAEMLELKANPKLRGRGVVIEGRMSSEQGAVATLLVKNGTLRLGDMILSGSHYGRVKAMFNDKLQRVDDALPSTPVTVLGLSGVPMAGDEFFVAKDEKKARTLSLLKQDEERDSRLKLSKRVTLEDFYKQAKEGVVKELRIILKADVQGSAEALKVSLEQLSTKEVQLNIIHEGVGNINESDVMLAVVSNCVIIGFNVKIDDEAEKTAGKEDIEIKVYGIIYEAIADVQAAMEGLLEPASKEVFVGMAQVRQVFRVSKVGTIAGSYVLKGKIVRSGIARLIRDKKIVHEGRISSLKRFKDDAREVAQDFECGIGLEGHDDIKEGDLIELYQIEKVARRLTK